MPVWSPLSQTILVKTQVENRTQMLRNISVRNSVLRHFENTLAPKHLTAQVEI